jgi:hypothetical protein
MNLLHWHRLIFLVPIGLGTVLAIGAALSLDGGGADHPEGDHETAHGHALDLGRLPLTIRLMLASLSFGGIGLSVTYLLGSVASPTHAALAAWIALMGAIFISGRLARVFAQRLPLFETETVTRRELLGSTGRAVLQVGPAGGLVQVHDRRGNLHQLASRSLKGEGVLAAGTPVVLVDYDEGRGLFEVTSDPTRGPSN